MILIDDIASGRSRNFFPRLSLPSNKLSWVLFSLWLIPRQAKVNPLKPRFESHLICLRIGDRAEMPSPVAVVSAMVSAMDRVHFRVSVCSDLPFFPIIFIGFDSKRIRLSTRWRDSDRPPGIYDRIVRNDQKI
jgi:hypothetical protein